ncbi:hypothetical protein FOXYSP1_02353 [Fusarium oxysporum f. sp. phaseoli]
MLTSTIGAYTTLSRLVRFPLVGTAFFINSAISCLDGT